MKELETFYWSTDPHSNNTETMDDYLNNHLLEGFEILEQYGSYAEIKNQESGAIYGLHASGNGDFCNHKIEFELIS